MGACGSKPDTDDAAPSDVLSTEARPEAAGAAPAAAAAAADVAAPEDVVAKLAATEEEPVVRLSSTHDQRMSLAGVMGGGLVAGQEQLHRALAKPDDAATGGGDATDMHSTAMSKAGLGTSLAAGAVDGRAGLKHVATPAEAAKAAKADPKQAGLDVNHRSEQFSDASHDEDAVHGGAAAEAATDPVLAAAAEVFPGGLAAGAIGQSFGGNAPDPAQAHLHHEHRPECYHDNHQDED